ncbi:MAG TPA: FmdB family zinc ribbon protein [Bryobacteraceae bacterium]|nr:FmdB family zinc ribbon protein [Bryobacteraceae bacterium]
MPIYEYKCHKCGLKFEVRQRISEAPLKAHADCGGELERLISAPALVFKGTGWYVTDYAKNGKSPSTASSESKSETKGDSASTKSESKSETKSQSKTESKSEPTPAAS